MTFDIYSDKDLVLKKIIKDHNHIILALVDDPTRTVVMEVGDVIVKEKKDG